MQVSVREVAKKRRHRLKQHARAGCHRWQTKYTRQDYDGNDASEEED